MKLGFVGLGSMGFAMAESLLAQGHQLFVYNRAHEKAQPLHEAGARICATPGEAAREAEVVISMLADDAAVEAVTFGPQRDPGGFAARCGPRLVQHDFGRALRTLGQRARRSRPRLRGSSCVWSPRSSGGQEAVAAGRGQVRGCRARAASAGGARARRDTLGRNRQRRQPGEAHRQRVHCLDDRVAR